MKRPNAPRCKSRVLSWKLVAILLRTHTISLFSSRSLFILASLLHHFRSSTICTIICHIFQLKVAGSSCLESAFKSANDTKRIIRFHIFLPQLLSITFLVFKLNEKFASTDYTMGSLAFVLGCSLRLSLSSLLERNFLAVGKMINFCFHI